MSDPADPSPVLDSLDGFRGSKAMFAALELGVFERLDQEPARADVLSRDLQLHPDAAERLLDAWVGMDLLAKRDGLYSNLPVATSISSVRARRRWSGTSSNSNGRCLRERRPQDVPAGAAPGPPGPAPPPRVPASQGPKA